MATFRLKKHQCNANTKIKNQKNSEAGCTGGSDFLKSNANYALSKLKFKTYPVPYF
jgi:hypothetical protein